MTPMAITRHGTGGRKMSVNLAGWPGCQVRKDIPMALEMFPPRFAFKISGKELNHLKSILFPMVRIDLPPRAGEERCRKDSDRLKVLDHHQEAQAGMTKGGKMFFPPHAGSRSVESKETRKSRRKEWE